MESLGIQILGRRETLWLVPFVDGVCVDNIDGAHAIIDSNKAFS